MTSHQWVYIVCDICRNPIKGKYYEFYEHARNANPSIPPHRFRITWGINELEVMQRGYPPMGYRQFCEGHDDRRAATVQDATE